MSILVGRNGKKRHNWVTNSTIVDKEADKIARQFIASTTFWTRAKQDELDKILSELPKPEHEHEIDVNDPDPDVIKALAETPDWMNTEPSEAELLEIENEMQPLKIAGNE